MRLIDADHLQRWIIARWQERDPRSDRPFRADEILAQIDRESSIDIVQCKDCKHWQPHEQYGYDEDNGEYHDYCRLLVPEDEYYAFRRKADDFCSYGEREDE